MAKGEAHLEVLCEEIPARMLRPALEEIAHGLFEGLTTRGLGPRAVRTGFTPRRLMVTLKGLPEQGDERAELVVGPPRSAAYDDQGQPTKAAVGFAKRCGVDIASLKTVETEKGEYLGAEVHEQGERTIDVLAELTPRVLARVNWPKQMRWGNGVGPWVRPIHGIVALFGGEVIPFTLFGTASGRSTTGHRVLSPRSFDVRGASDYLEKLRRRDIEIDFSSRRDALWTKMEQAASEVEGTLVEDPPLLDKLTSICEIPGVLVGDFDPSFLELPREILVASLRDHQSAFTVEAAGKLLPHFVTVMDRTDDPESRVRAGNEWVVEARLADAQFFYREDRKSPLVERSASLERLSFHAKLGSYADKTARIRELARIVAERLDWSEDKDHVEEAATLLKADLTSEVVKEFTSLQGVIGGVFAREDGHSEPVWQAIYDQYLPVSSTDSIPRSRAGIATGIADRIDTLVGIFGLGLIPSGSRDPFGLRRAAQGVVRMVLEADLPLDIDMLAARAVLLYEDRLERGGDEVLSDLRPFVEDRVRHLLGREGFAYDEIEAAIAAGASDLPDLRARVAALHAVREAPEFLSVVLAAKRIANILKEAPESQLSESLLEEAAERDLFEAGGKLKAEVREAEAARDYEVSFRAIAKFADVLERFFVEVLVMDENPELRQNRIALLQSVQRTVSRTARLTEMVVDRTELRRSEAANE